VSCYSLHISKISRPCNSTDH